MPLRQEKWVSVLAAFSQKLFNFWPDSLGAMWPSLSIELQFMEKSTLVSSAFATLASSIISAKKNYLYDF